MTDFRPRIRRLEELAGLARRQVRVLVKQFGESDDDCALRLGVTARGEAEAADIIIFISKFTDPSQRYIPRAPEPPPRVAASFEPANALDGEIQGLLRELEASGVSPAEIQAALEGKTALAAPEEEVPDACLSPECLEERRRLDQLWASHEVRGAPLLRPPEELRADDLVGLMNKRRRH